MNLRQYTKEFGYNLRLATPVILSMLGHTLVGFVDTAMVGKLGPTELAAVSLGNSIVFLVMALGIGFSTAITTLVAEAAGTNDFSRGKSVLKHGLIICGFLSFFLMLGLFFSEEIMILTHQDPSVIALAVPYIDLVALSVIPLMIFQVYKQFSDGVSLTKYAMYATFITNGINVLLNYLFIYGNFGCPKLGVLGAGVGTLVSRIIMPFLLYHMLYRNEKTKPYIINLRWKSVNFRLIRKITNLGIPSSLQMIFEAGIFIAATWISGALHKNYQASNQIALSLASMTFMISAGMSTAAMIRVGNLKGMKDYLNLRRVAISVFLFVAMCQIGLVVLYAIFSDWIPQLFLDTNDIGNASDIAFVIEDAQKLLIIAGIFQIPDGIQIVALGALRGIQDVKIPAIISFIAYWVIAFPVSYYLGVYTEWATSGIWIGLLVGLTVAAILLTYRFLHFTKKMIS